MLDCVHPKVAALLNAVFQLIDCVRVDLFLANITAELLNVLRRSGSRDREIPADLNRRLVGTALTKRSSLCLQIKDLFYMTTFLCTKVL